MSASTSRWQRLGPDQPEDGFHLVLSQPAKLFLAQLAVPDEIGKHQDENRIPIVVPAVNLLTALSQIELQVPQVGRFLDLANHLLSFPDYRRQLPSQRRVKRLPRDGLFCRRPLQ